MPWAYRGHTMGVPLACRRLPAWREFSDRKGGGGGTGEVRRPSPSRARPPLSVQRVLSARAQTVLARPSSSFAAKTHGNPLATHNDPKTRSDVTPVPTCDNEAQQYRADRLRMTARLCLCATDAHDAPQPSVEQTAMAQAASQSRNHALTCAACLMTGGRRTVRAPQSTSVPDWSLSDA